MYFIFRLKCVQYKILLDISIKERRVSFHSYAVLKYIILFQFLRLSRKMFDFFVEGEIISLKFLSILEKGIYFMILYKDTICFLECLVKFDQNYLYVRKNIFLK